MASTHDDIIKRVGALEHRVGDVEDQVEKVSALVVENRRLFKAICDDQRDSIAETHTELVAFRGEFQGTKQGLGWGLTALAFLITTLVSVLGFVLA